MSEPTTRRNFLKHSLASASALAVPGGIATAARPRNHATQGRGVSR